MAFFVLKFVPHRANFPADLSEAEAAAMQEHVAYWRRQAENRVAVLYGPVGDPAGVWGLAVVEVEALPTAQALRDQDPVVLAGLGVIDVYPMLDAVLR